MNTYFSRRHLLQSSPVSYFPEISGSYRYRIIRCGIHGSQTSPVKSSGCLFCFQDLVDQERCRRTRGVRVGRNWPFGGLLSPDSNTATSLRWTAIITLIWRTTSEQSCLKACLSSAWSCQTVHIRCIAISNTMNYNIWAGGAIKWKIQQ